MVGLSIPVAGVAFMVGFWENYDRLVVEVSLPEFFRHVANIMIYEYVYDRQTFTLLVSGLLNLLYDK